MNPAMRIEKEWEGRMGASLKVTLRRDDGREVKVGLPRLRQLRREGRIAAQEVKP